MLKYLSLLSFIIFSCHASKVIQQPILKDISIDAKNSSIQYTGRIDSTEHVTIYWPGTSIKYNFKGTNTSILLHDNMGENILNVIIDGQEPISFLLDSTKHWYQIADNLENKVHSVEIYKRTEWDHGPTSFYNFKTNGSFLDAPLPKDRIIEFFGNSITTGYANEDFSGKDQADGLKTNNYAAYSAVTARKLNADMYCTSKAGIGIMVSWFPLIMPELYDRLNPEDPDSKWDFNKVTPDIVVINLFQNDHILLNKKSYPQVTARFGNTKPTDSEIIDAYKAFLQKIVSMYPNTPILCTLGNMDASKEGSKWPGYIETAVQSTGNDKIHTLFFPYKETAGHPSVREHEVMSNLLEQEIREIMKW